MYRVEVYLYIDPEIRAKFLERQFREKFFRPISIFVSKTSIYLGNKETLREINISDSIRHVSLYTERKK